MRFQSFYWEGADVPAEERSTVERLEDTDRPVTERKAALLHLLETDSVIARSIALDFYSLSNANLRHGNEPMIDAAIDAAVRACALRELAEPPYQRAEANANPRRGANHASALHALGFNADPADAALVARILLENQDDRVLSQGVGTAEPVLRGGPAHPALVDALLLLARRPSLEPSTRAGAIAAIAASADEAVVPMLVEAARDPELAVSAAGARGLLERDVDRYRLLVEPIVASWPAREFPPFDVLEVHRLLEDD
ncbi:MAG TPA: hypothetical protein VF469_29885 [Kofleriaceae bacterium]